ncbi:putative N6-adenine-specific methylase [Sterolibacterium denitrificans]|uniref:Methyltransferase n=2 Tax=Sterolibacterium denitrificans TaxID=157592 RepID=A0A656Z885_9PROT|nr:16S rRNA (guanine(966)-N(2))-methyltransferase RsmD [Sterolibacterium denitrificans]KYC29068.1 methyltransferase [Sterolibacterium denitrificans]SMB21366.1 putative N6-adenine-specific methylase [Sterolibacterium denitrificans]
MARIRITGGEWRSRLVKVSDQAQAQALRPTPDRVRITLFNWLGHDLAGLRCLDLFAGSGILGFEAASRGAAQVTFVEQAPVCFRMLQQNAAALAPGQAAGRLELIRADALKFLSSVSQPYDLLFLDPPYRQGWLEQVAPLLARAAKPDARLYVEAEHAVDALGPWRSVKRAQAGQVFYQLLEQPCPTESPSIPAPSIP